MTPSSAPGGGLHAGNREWPLLRAKPSRLGLKGNLVTDAWIAAAAEAVSEHLVTFDTGSRKLLPVRDVTVLALPAP